jgi:hypothetical protein
MTEEQTQEATEPLVQVRRLVIETDGTQASVTHNDMGLLEMRSILQMLYKQVETTINQAAQAPAEPEAPADEAAEDQEDEE